jgi:hypothetical protein
MRSMSYYMLCGGQCQHDFSCAFVARREYAHGSMRASRLSARRHLSRPCIASTRYLRRFGCVCYGMSHEFVVVGVYQGWMRPA